MAPLTAHNVIFYSKPPFHSLLLFPFISGCPRLVVGHLCTKCAIGYEDVTLFRAVCMQRRGYASISSLKEFGPANKAKVLNERGLTRWVSMGPILQFMGISPEDIPHRLEHCSLVTIGLTIRVWLWKIERVVQRADVRSRYLQSWTDDEKFQKDDKYEDFFEDLLERLIASGARNLATLLLWWGNDHHGDNVLRTLLERFIAKEGRKIFEIFDLRHILNLHSVEISENYKDLRRSGVRKLSIKIFKDSKDGRWILTQIMTHGFLHYGALTDMKNRSLDAYCMFKDQSLGFVATTKIKSKIPNDPLK